MFKRFSAYFILIFLFAFAQIGAASHEISHLKDLSHTSKQDQNTHQNQCEQCVSFAKVASGLIGHVFIFIAPEIGFQKDLTTNVIAVSLVSFYFSARAPPQIA
jgi:hypothetical protein